MSRFADQSIHQVTWLRSVAQGWPVVTQGSNFAGQPTHQPDHFDVRDACQDRSAKDGTLPRSGLRVPSGSDSSVCALLTASRSPLSSVKKCH